MPLPATAGPSQHQHHHHHHHPLPTSSALASPLISRTSAPHRNPGIASWRAETGNNERSTPPPGSPGFLRRPPSLPGEPRSVWRSERPSWLHCGRRGYTLGGNQRLASTVTTCTTLKLSLSSPARAAPIYQLETASRGARPRSKPRPLPQANCQNGQNFEVECHTLPSPRP